MVPILSSRLKMEYQLNNRERSVPSLFPFRFERWVDEDCSALVHIAGDRRQWVPSRLYPRLLVHELYYRTPLAVWDNYAIVLVKKSTCSQTNVIIG